MSFPGFSHLTSHSLPSFSTASHHPNSLPNPSPLLPAGVVKCAIQECTRPCFVDPSGKVHECCGFTHAMEHQRRQAIQQREWQADTCKHMHVWLLGQRNHLVSPSTLPTEPAANMVKGVTHCLLPECSNPCWPFMNYCGKTHAQQGMQRGLQGERGVKEFERKRRHQITYVLYLGNFLSL